KIQQECRNRIPAMQPTISQILYPNRQAFFEKLAQSLPLQPAVKIGPAPLPNGARRVGLRNMRRAVPSEKLSTAQRSMAAARWSSTNSQQGDLSYSTSLHWARRAAGRRPCQSRGL